MEKNDKKCLSAKLIGKAVCTTMLAMYPEYISTQGQRAFNFEVSSLSWEILILMPCVNLNVINSAFESSSYYLMTEFPMRVMANFSVLWQVE